MWSIFSSFQHEFLIPAPGACRPLPFISQGLKDGCSFAYQWECFTLLPTVSFPVHFWMPPKVLLLACNVLNILELQYCFPYMLLPAAKIVWTCWCKVKTFHFTLLPSLLKCIMYTGKLEQEKSANFSPSTRMQPMLNFSALIIRVQTHWTSVEIIKTGIFLGSEKSDKEKWMRKWSYIAATVSPPKCSCITHRGREVY